MIRSSIIASALVLALGGPALAASPSPAPTPGSITVTLAPQHGSKIGGTATIVHGSPPTSVVVTIVLDGVFIPENRYPAGIYRGSCAQPAGEPVYPLEPVMGGRSTTRLKVKPPMPGRYVIAVFRTDGTQTMSCGELPVMRHSHGQG